MGDLFLVDLWLLAGDRGLPLGPEVVDLLAGGGLRLAQRRRLFVLLRVDGAVLLPRDALEVLLRLAEARRRGGVAQADAAGRFVDQVDRLIGQVPVGDVASGEVDGRLDGTIGDLDLVVLLVALADPHEDLDRLFDRRLIDHHRLEAALEGGIPLDVLAVLVERRGADALQLAPCQRWLEDVGRVYCAFGGAGADEGMELVDEQHGVVGAPQLLDDLLESLLELAAVLGAGHEGADVEREDSLVQECLRDVPADDAMGQALRDGRLADTRLADERRVVLGPAAQDLDDALDFLLASDDRIELAEAGRFGQVDAELVDRGGLAGALCFLRGTR